MKILSGSSSNFAPKWFLNLIICSSTSPQHQAVSYGFGNGGTESPSEAWLATWWQFWTHIYSLRQFWGVAARVKKSHQDYKEVKLDHHLLLCTNQDKRPHGDKKEEEVNIKLGRFCTIFIIALVLRSWDPESRFQKSPEGNASCHEIQYLQIVDPV